MSAPAMRTRPRSGASKRLMQRSNVLFPAPLSPTSASAAALDTAMDTSESAGRVPNDFVRCSTTTSGAAGIPNDAATRQPALLGGLGQQVLRGIAMRGERRSNRRHELL